MARLTDKLSSKYFESQNALNKRTGAVVRVFVENEDDVPFWKHIFNQYDLKTQVNPASKTNLARGKPAVLKHIDNAGKYLLLCVDSDYDYLLDGATQLSKKIKENPFVFQTYTYSIENYKCFAESLPQVVVEATLNDQPVFNFVDFMEQYSEMIYELFIYSFYYEKQYQQEMELHQKEYQVKKNQLNEAELTTWQDANRAKHSFQINDFCETIKIKSQVNIFNEGKQELANLQQAVTQRLESLPKVDDSELETLKEELAKLGVKSNNTYLFVQGHTIYENVVCMFLNKVFNHLKKQKFGEFRHLAKTDGGKEKINEYNNLVKDIRTILDSHKYYESCLLMQKIKDDVGKYKVNEDRVTLR